MVFVRLLNDVIRYKTLRRVLFSPYIGGFSRGDRTFLVSKSYLDIPKAWENKKSSLHLVNVLIQFYEVVIWKELSQYCSLG